VIVNHAKGVRFEEGGCVAAESGASLATLARRCMNQGLAGLEWAVNVPGTVGGAVINNAGAHGGNMAASLRWLSCLMFRTGLMSRCGREPDAVWLPPFDLEGDRGRYVVLGATLVLEPGHDPDALNAKADEFVAHRKRTQPPGASLAASSKTRRATTRDV